MLEYLCGKRFGLKIAWANRKECDRVGAGPAPTLSPFFLLAQAIFKPNLFPYKYSSILKPSHSSYLSTYEDGTDRVFWNVGI